MVVGFIATYSSVPITTNVVRIKFVSDLRQGGGFLLALWFPPSIKLIATK
jgi:hypothetical protein